MLAVLITVVSASAERCLIAVWRRSQAGLTSLLLAADRGQADIMRALIDAKADQTVMQNGKTAIELLLRASAVEHGNFARAIAMSGADVNLRNEVRRQWCELLGMEVSMRLRNRNKSTIFLLKSGGGRLR